MLTLDSPMATMHSLPLDVVRAIPHGHVVDEVVSKLEEDLALALGSRLLSARPLLAQKLARATAIFPQGKNRGVMMVMMGTYRIPLNAADWRSSCGIRAAWLFDAWPDSLQDLRELVHTFGLTHLFVTAKQSALAIEKIVTPCQVEWLPEPLIDLGFSPVPWSKRKDSVMQFGRKYELYHDSLLYGMKSVHFDYRFEKTKGEVLFPTTEEFLFELGRTKISVCFPSDITHPERAGSVSTMTQRYLQSMASGCLILGSSPPEMIELFGYDPVVPADLNDPAGQLSNIIACSDEYLPLIERNLFEVKAHTVKNRANTITAALHN